MLALTSGGTILASSVYILGYSFATGFPIFAFVSVDDFLVVSIPWLIPYTGIVTLGYIGGRTRSMVESRSGQARPDKVKAPGWFRRNSQPVMWGSAGLFFVLMVLITDLKPLVYAPLVTIPVMLDWSDFLNNSARGRAIVDLIGKKYHELIFYGPVLVLIAATIGLSDGASGKRYFFSAQPSEISIDTPPAILTGKIAFSFSDHLVIRSVEDNEISLVPNRIVLGITRPRSSEVENGEVVIQDSVHTNTELPVQ